MSWLASISRTFARNIDYGTTSRAPLETHGAHHKSHAAETRVVHLEEVLSKPVLSYADLRALNDFVKHGEALDDRKMLLERLLTKMATFKEYNISLRLQKFVIDLLYKDLPHPQHGFLSPLKLTRTIYASAQTDSHTVPSMPKYVHYAYRAADGSNYNPLIPGIGKAGSPYARSVASTSLTPVTTLPDPGLVFDTLLKRDKFVPHPDGISSLFFAFADLVIHSIFNTDTNDWSINKASSYLDLSILYGSSDQEVDSLRVKDGTGKLKPDCFADSRLLRMPPASCALLILLNRNHNYIAQKLLEINESRRFKDPAQLSPEDKTIQDDEIFHRTRLVNCGYFMHIILGDYVGAILGLVRDGNDWRLDPLMEMREIDHELSQRGAGNVVSIEFNLLYRWHSSLSQENVKWFEAGFSNMLPKDASPASVTNFKKDIRHLEALSKSVPPWEWTFGGLNRVKGQFEDVDLAKILQDATQEVSGAFQARGIPACMRMIEVFGIAQSRQWGTCSLNEFRKFMGLAPYTNFLEWNPDPEIATAAESLYKHIDRLELYVGLQAEEAKVPQEGAGLCPGYTISRAILSDAVCLTRGDRFLTTDFTPFNLTAWGWQDCQYDKEDGSYGGMLTKLLFRTLPDQYPAGSALAHFPFNIPQRMFATLTARNDGSVIKYQWPASLEKELPEGWQPLKAPQNSIWKTVNDIEGVKKILSNETNKFTSTVPQRQKLVVDSVLPRKRDDEKEAIFKVVKQKQDAVTDFIVEGDDRAQWFKKKTAKLMEERAFEQAGSKGVKYVDIVKDVINLLSVHWICEEITGIPLKSQCNPRGMLWEQETCDKFADISRYTYMNFDPVNDFKLRERSQNHAKEMIDFIMESLETTDSHFASLGGDVLEWVRITKKSDSAKLLKKLRSRIGSGATNTTLAINVFNATIPTAPLFSKAIAQVVDYFLDDENQHARDGLVNVFQSNEVDASAKIMGYVREALRLRPLFAGVYRTVSDPDTAVHVKTGDLVFVDIATANDSIGGNPYYARPAGQQGILSPYSDGLLTPKFFESVVPVVVGTILSQKDIRRASGESGELTKFGEMWHGTQREQYVNISGLVTPWPDAMIVAFGAQA